MTFYKTFAVLSILFCCATWAALSFTEQPSIQFNPGAGDWTIRFAVSESTDVEVAVVSAVDNSIVRRLVAGRLGANAPAPMTAGTLSQVITWDGLDDLGAAVHNGSALSVRVRAGLSVSLDRMTEENPYYYGGLSGVAVLADGSLIVQGVHEYGRLSRIRQFAKDGAYRRTLYPLPADLALSDRANWSTIDGSGGGFRPAYSSYVAGLRFASDQFLGTTVMPFTSDGRLVFFNRSTFGCVSVHPENLSRVDGPVKLITYPASTPNGGPFLFNRGPAGTEQVFLTGAYNYKYDYVTDPSGYNYKFTLAGTDTGFWQDGSLYKLDVQSGVVSLWKDLIPRESIPDFRTTERIASIGPGYSQPGDWTTKNYAAIHGLAFDDSGRVYVCDRLHGRVAVYDTATWSLQGAITVRRPHLVEVNANTGDVFVLSWAAEAFGSNVMHVYKYAGFRDSPVSSAHFSMVPGDPGCNFGLMPSVFLSCADGQSTLLYVAVGSVFLVLRDTGSGFEKVRDFNELSRGEQTYQVPAMYERIALDRKTETVYTSNGWEDLYKISDWSACRPVPCSTSAGRALHAADAAVSPDGQYLYVREAVTQNHESGWWGPVNKYAIGPRLSPADFKGTNQVHDYFSGKWGAWFGDKGLAVSREGRVAIIDGFDDMDNVLQITDADSTFHDSVIYPLGEWGRGGRFGLLPTRPYNSGCVKFDFDGNLYVGASTKSPDHVVPAEYAASVVYHKNVGAVYKFPSTGGGIYGAPDLDSTRNVLKIYPQGFGAFSGDEGGGTCRCRSPRFDLDPYGRLFIPNGILSRVTVADNNGNDITAFGEYGNADSKGPGSLVPGPAIPLATPQCVAASDNYIYITDWNNARLVRVKMDYELNSMPAVVNEMASAHPLSPMLSLFPNPLSSATEISMTLPGAGEMRLTVFDAAGRIVRSLMRGSSPKGALKKVWDGRDNAGSPVASGIYLVRLETAGKALTHRLIVAR